MLGDSCAVQCDRPKPPNRSQIAEMKMTFWITVAVAVATCLAFPPLILGWVVAFIGWAIADRRFINKKSSRPKSTHSLGVEVSVVGAVENDHRPTEMREQVESTLSAPGLYETIPENYIHKWEERAEMVVLPPNEWRIKGATGRVVVNGDWIFPLKAASEEDWQLYVYSVKGFPNLHKIGIANDVLKRKEKYYGRCIKKWTLPKRDAVLVEHLFKHATYGLANKKIPRWNVGNADEENLRPEVLELWEQFPESKGLTEVRLISAEAAKTTLEQIQQDLKWHLKVDELVLKYGIKTFGGDPSGRATVQIPHRFWRLKPHHKPKQPDPESETQAELYKNDLKEHKEEANQCWDPNWTG